MSGLLAGLLLRDLLLPFVLSAGIARLGPRLGLGATVSVASGVAAGFLTAAWLLLHADVGLPPGAAGKLLLVAPAGAFAAWLGVRTRCPLLVGTALLLTVALAVAAPALGRSGDRELVRTALAALLALATWVLLGRPGPGPASPPLAPAVVALGIAGTAFFARTGLFAELALMLAAALAGSATRPVAGRDRALASLPGTGLLTALGTALVLYTQAPADAAGLLGLAIPLAASAGRLLPHRSPPWAVLLLVAAAAIVRTRTAVGPPLYSG